MPVRCSISIISGSRPANAAQAAPTWRANALGPSALALLRNAGSEKQHRLRTGQAVAGERCMLPYARTDHDRGPENLAAGLVHLPAQPGVPSQVDQYDPAIGRQRFNLVIGEHVVVDAEPLGELGVDRRREADQPRRVVA